MRRMCLWVLLTASCQQTSPPGEAELYVRAVSDRTLPEEERLELCAALTSADRRAECVAAIVASGRLSAERCGAIPEGRWRDECWFRLAEHKAVRAPIPEAAEMCRRAGQFFRSCTGHIMSRQLLALLRTTDADTEHDEVARFAAEWAAAVGKEKTERDAWRFYWERKFAEGVDPARCDGEVQSESCEEALVSTFRVQVKALLKEDPGRWCAVSQAELRQAVVTEWVSPPGEARWPALDGEIVRKTGQLCR